jgi:hypothetical protein
VQGAALDSLAGMNRDGGNPAGVLRVHKAMVTSRRANENKPAF